MSAWYWCTDASNIARTECRHAEHMFVRCLSKGWTRIPGNYSNAIRSHYRWHHAKEQDLTLVEDSFTGWYIFTNDPALIRQYGVHRLKDDWKRVEGQRHNMSIAAVTAKDLLRNLNIDMRRVAEDIENIESYL